MGNSENTEMGEEEAGESGREVVLIHTGESGAHREKGKKQNFCICATPFFLITPPPFIFVFL